jgi:ABC-type Na+ efflux pump permease subunit
MFKNFGTVLRFSLKNMAGTKGFKVVTVIFSIIFLIAPAIILIAIGYNSSKDKTLKSCTAKTVYVADETSSDKAFWSGLSSLPEEDYKNLKYEVFESREEAFEKAKGDESGIILIVKDNNGLVANVIIPEGSKVEKGNAKNYLKFIKAYNRYFTIGLLGLSEEELAVLDTDSSYDTYSETGYGEGLSIAEDVLSSEELMREQVMKVVSMALPYATIMLLYFMLLSYGQTLAQSVVMEKESKLMDTMLISVRTESLIFGKLLAAIITAMIQAFSWIVALAIGFSAGSLISKAYFPAGKNYLSAFIDGMKELNVFRPVNVVVGLLFLLLSFVLYFSLAAIAGAMSSTKEEVSSKASLFVFPLLISFFILIFAGGMNAETTKTWMLIVPFTGGMILPANVMLGYVSWPVILAAFVAFAVLIVFLVYMAGRIYQMMSLYKGNKISISEVLKRTFEGTRN